MNRRHNAPMPDSIRHFMRAGQHLPKVIRADGDHRGQTDGRHHGIAAANPVPEAKHVGRIDAEFGNLFGVGGDGDEVLGDYVIPF